MDEQQWLAERFEKHRGHLRAVAYRMLGGAPDADDAVQEAWLRVSRSDTSDVDNVGGWLTTVVARVCLNMLRSRRVRSQQALDEVIHRPLLDGEPTIDPEQEALLADTMGLALLVVLDQLPPAQRVAFVLHDMFDLPYDEIAPIVDRSPDAARQLASRARRRVRGSSAALDADLSRQREIVEAFLAASRDGQFNALIAMLDPDVVLRADAAAAQIGAPRELRGAHAVADIFSGGARAATASTPGWRHRRRLDVRGTATGRVQLHRQQGKDRRDRSACRSRTPQPARRYADAVPSATSLIHARRKEADRAPRQRHCGRLCVGDQRT